jgi:hypothetical protein
MTDKIYLAILVLFLIIVLIGDIKFVDGIDNVKNKLKRKK